LFHHVMGETDGRRGVWAYVRGGMGTISNATAAYFLSQRGEIVVNAEVRRVLVKDGRCQGVVLADGREIRSNVVLSNADPQRTFLGLFDPLDLPERLVDDVKAMRFKSGTVKINVAANGLPDFKAYPGTQPGPQHRGTIHFCPSMDYIERAYDDARWGRPSARPVVEMCIPSVVDDTLAPPGKHLLSLFVQYAPYERADGRPWDAVTEKEYAESVFAVIREYVTNWDEIVDDYQVLSPKGLEDVFGLTGGNIFHGEMTLDQLFHLRPAPGTANYATPIKGFYLCGAGTHPGGGVLGASGYLAARRVLRDWPK
ncbi:MAG: phytoene desaturase family protein, partial [Planctomycetia bacterium]